MRTWLPSSVCVLGLLLLSTATLHAQVDASIPLRVQTPQPMLNDPLETFRRVQQLKLQQQEIQQRQDELDRSRRQEFERQRSASQPEAARASQMKVPPLVNLLQPDQFAAVGLSKLNSSEMAQLDSWFSVFLNSYTKILYEGIVARRPTGSYLEAHSAPIDEVLKDGEIVRLLDGSEWQVQIGESVRSSLWLSSSDVFVVKAANIGDVAMLIHGRDAVHATRIR